MVRTGLEVLFREKLGLLAGRRLGLVSQAAAVLPDLTGIVDALLSPEAAGAGLRLTALFGAEHGFAGAAVDGDAVTDMNDRRTGLPIYSLYGEIQEPTPAMLTDLDALLVDFQDAGSRYYTFLATLFYVLRAAGEAGLPVFVLDRPNPINGLNIEGPLVEPGLESLVGIVPIPIRHGMTMGELALYLNSTFDLQAALTVIPMQGWQRGMWFDETGLPWAPPSPAMPHLSTTVVYPGMCLLEGTNLSEGRGTALPFEVAGAPWLDGHALAAQLNRLALPGVRFRAHTFQPSASKFAGQVCEGVQLHVLDRLTFRPVLTGLHVLAACRELALDSFEFLPPYLEGKPAHMDLLAGSASLRQYLSAGMPVDELTGQWSPAAAQFEQQRAPFLLYR